MCAIFADSNSQNKGKFLDWAFISSCKCIFINKDWEKSDQNSLGSYILVGKVGNLQILKWIHATFFHSSFDGLLDMIIVARLG